MKHLKKFNESSNSDVDILKEYFFNIIDDLEGICELEIIQNTSNYFTIKISPSLKIKSTITQDSTELINDWISSNNNSSMILNELKSSISRLQDENILESFTLRKYLSLSNTEGYILEIYTKLKSDEEIENWIFVDEYTAWVDGLRLKKYLKSQFDVDFKDFELGEDYDRHGDRYIQFTIHFQNPVQKIKLEEIKEVLLKKQVNIEMDDEDIEIFTECYYPKFQETSTYMTFVLHEWVSDTR